MVHTEITDSFNITGAYKSTKRVFIVTDNNWERGDIKSDGSTNFYYMA